MADVQDLSTIADNISGVPNSSSQASGKFGIYRAKCVDTQDPLKSGRIRVFIPALNLEMMKENEGIWALPCSPFAGSNLEVSAVNDIGSLLVPPKDSLVYVFFEDGDTSKPRYFGGVVLENAVPTENRAGKQYWNKHTILKTPNKRIIFVSDDSKSDAGVIIRGSSGK